MTWIPCVVSQPHSTRPCGHMIVLLTNKVILGLSVFNLVDGLGLRNVTSHVGWTPMHVGAMRTPCAGISLHVIAS